MNPAHYFANYPGSVFQADRDVSHICNFRLRSGDDSFGAVTTVFFVEKGFDDCNLGTAAIPFFKAEDDGTLFSASSRGRDRVLLLHPPRHQSYVGSRAHTAGWFSILQKACDNIVHGDL